MQPTPLLILSCLGAGLFGAICPMILALVRQIHQSERSYVSLNRRPTMDSDLRVAGHLTILGLVVATIGIWLGWPDNNLFWIPTGLASWFLGNAYGFVYARTLNRFYLTRARRLMNEGDEEGAREDAHEVIRSSPALRFEAQSTLRALDQAGRVDQMPKSFDTPFSPKTLRTN